MMGGILGVYNFFLYEIKEKKFKKELMLCMNLLD